MVNAIQCTVSVDNLDINESTLYSIIVKPQATSTAYTQKALYFEFPKDTGITVDASMTCSSTDTGTYDGSPVCTTGVTSSGTVWLKVTTLITRQFSYSIGFNGIVNPGSAKSVSDVACHTCTTVSCGTYLESYSRIRLSFASVILSTGIEISSNSLVNGAEGVTLNYDVIIGNPFPALGIVYLTVPKQNYNFLELGAPTRECILLDCNDSDMTVTAAYAASNSATLETTITINQVYFLFEETGTDHDTFQIFLGNTAAIPAGKELRFKINPVKNPPSLKPLKTFSGWTADFDENKIESWSGFSYVTTLPGEFLSTSSVSILDTQSGVDEYMVSEKLLSYFFVVNLNTNDIPYETLIYVTFPSGWSLDCSTDQYSVISNKGCNFQAIVCDQSSNTLKLYGGFEAAAANSVSANQNYLSYKTGQLEFTIKGIDNPIATKGQYITVQSYQVLSGLFEIDSSYSMFYLEWNTGSITIDSIIPTDSYIYSTDGTYTFTFTPQHAMLTTYTLKITLPVELEVQQNSACIMYDVDNDEYSCGADATANTITLINFLTSDLGAGDEITFSVDSIRNPVDYVTPGLTLFKITSSDGGEIDDGEFNKYSDGTDLYEHSFIKTFTVKAGNYIAGRNPVTYTFTIVPHTKVALGATIVIDVPTELSIDSAQQLSRACPGSSFSGFSYTSINCQYSSGSSQITVTNGFKRANSVSNPPTIVFSITQFKNPRSLAPISMFNATIYNKNMSPLFYFNSSDGPTILMTSTDAPKEITFERSKVINGQNTNYTWQVKVGNYYENGDIITFKLPSGIRFTDQSRCYGTSFWLDGEIACTLSGDRQTVNFDVVISARRRLIEEFESPRRNLASQIPAGSLINFMFTEITSPDSKRPINENIKYQVKDPDGYDIESLTQKMVIANTQLGEFNTSYSEVTPDYWENSVMANYTVSFSPNNFEQNLQILITAPSQITVPYGVICRGVTGTDSAVLTCLSFPQNGTILITDAVTEKDVAPEVITIILQQLENPTTNIVTDTFKIKTITYDGYDIDEQVDGLSVNFFCMFPCKSCNDTTPTICESCYTVTTPFKFLLDQQCLEGCPDGMFETNLTTSTPTCGFCEFPCVTCEMNATDCRSCPPGFLLYDIDHTCYEEIIWFFPFLGAAVVCFIVVLFVDCCCKSTNFLHSLLFFLALLEDAVVGFLIYMWIIGEVEGDRSLTLLSLSVHCLLNIIFMIVHLKLMLKNGSPEYKQVYKNYCCTSWLFQTMGYVLNFKISLILVSSFASRPRFSGTFNNDSWQKFNIFAVLYIGLVYLPFTADFYIYFSTYGLRKLTSFIAAEATIIMTIICLILLLEVLSQCACSGINESDLGKRAGLIREKNKKNAKKKRRAQRSGMGNDESDYDDEYDSQEDYGTELDELKGKRALNKQNQEVSVEEVELEESEEYYDEEEQQSVVDSMEGLKDNMNGYKNDSMKKIKKNARNPQLDMLEDLAKQMKEEKEGLKAEQEKILGEKLKLLEEKERYLAEFGDLDVKLQNQRNSVNDDLTRMQSTIQTEMDKKLLERDTDELMRKGGNRPTIMLPEPICKEVELSKSIDGDEEYWLQNLSGIQDGVSDNAPGGAGIKYREASEIAFMEPVSARMSNIGSMREMQDDIEQRLNQSQGPIFDNDLGGALSRHGTEQNFINRSNAALSQINGDARSKERTQEEYYDGVSGVYSNPSHISGLGALSKHQTEQNFLNKSDADFDNTSALVQNQEIANPERRESADFGNVSQHLPMDKSIHGQLTPRPEMDQNGHSDESSEGIVAYHKPFNGIKDAMANQDQLRKSMRPESQSEEEEEKNNDNGPRRRIKQVLYSDKSESSVDDMMEDTPSNYNIANGRLEGKSMGLKAILLYAKNQGVQLGTGLPQIQEENALNRESVQQSSGENSNWKNINQPMNGGATRTRTQIAGADEINRTLDNDGRGGPNSKNYRSKRNPGSKQFREPAETGELSARASNNDMGKIQKNNFV